MADTKTTADTNSPEEEQIAADPTEGDPEYNGVAKPFEFYANFPDKDFPISMHDGLPAPYYREDFDTCGVVYSYSCGEYDITLEYFKQLESAGFVAKSERQARDARPPYTDDFAADPETPEDERRVGLTTSVFMKERENQPPLVVVMDESAHNLYIQLCTMFDPRGLYSMLPDKHLLFPLDKDGLAAEYHDFYGPSEYSVEYAYIYKNKPHSFVSNYEERLRKAGFKNTRAPGETPQYEKTCEDNVHLSIAIEVIDEIRQIHVKMKAVKPEAD